MRYSLFEGSITENDVIAICPFNDTMVEIIATDVAVDDDPCNTGGAKVGTYRFGCGDNDPCSTGKAKRGTYGCECNIWMGGAIAIK